MASNILEVKIDADDLKKAIFGKSLLSGIKWDNPDKLTEAVMAKINTDGSKILVALGLTQAPSVLKEHNITMEVKSSVLTFHGINHVKLGKVEIFPGAISSLLSGKLAPMSKMSLAGKIAAKIQEMTQEAILKKKVMKTMKTAQNYGMNVEGSVTGKTQSKTLNPSNIPKDAQADAPAKGWKVIPVDYFGPNNSDTWGLKIGVDYGAQVTLDSGVTVPMDTWVIWSDYDHVSTEEFTLFFKSLGFEVTKKQGEKPAAKLSLISQNHNGQPYDPDWVYMTLVHMVRTSGTLAPEDIEQPEAQVAWS